MFLPSIFYATADEAGVLVYHDMMNRDYFSGMQAEVNAYRNTIRRLSQHPSIAIWDGCNECNPNQGQIGTTVMTIVTSEDSSRPIWPSCPAQGWATGVNRLSSLPNGRPLKPVGSLLGAIETHGPYQHGDGWPAVNGDNTHLNLFNTMLPLSLNPTTSFGLAHTNTFTSEFGSVGWSSFESVAPTLAPEHWALHGGAKADNCSGGFSSKCRGDNVMAQRNYPCDSILITYFGGQQSDLDEVGELSFKKQLFQCLYGQALVLKGYIEQHRATNTFGLQIWQLNEIWRQTLPHTAQPTRSSVHVIGTTIAHAHLPLRASLCTFPLSLCSHRRMGHHRVRHGGGGWTGGGRSLEAGPPLAAGQPLH